MHTSARRPRPYAERIADADSALLGQMCVRMAAHIDTRASPPPPDRTACPALARTSTCSLPRPTASDARAKPAPLAALFALAEAARSSRRIAEGAAGSGDDPAHADGQESLPESLTTPHVSAAKPTGRTPPSPTPRAPSPPPRRRATPTSAPSASSYAHRLMPKEPTSPVVRRTSLRERPRSPPCTCRCASPPRTIHAWLNTALAVAALIVALYR